MLIKTYMTFLSSFLTQHMVYSQAMPSVATFASLFKKYRLKSEFETLTEFGGALEKRGLHYEDSIFSHWQ
ncbi:hypothetical protein COU89_00865, partial [Candidatus Roizmanbacteria bacterium CG10_big_fil_rev_8_21_14_0_10_45_7]